jgi:hypothetical protein
MSAAPISLNLVAISLFPIPEYLNLCGEALAEAMLYCNSNTALSPLCRRIAGNGGAAKPASPVSRAAPANP